MMTCKQLIDFLADYKSGDLPNDQREVFEQHLSLCPPCLKYLETYCDTVDLAKDACKCEDDRPAEMPEALIQAILKACDASDENDCGPCNDNS